MTSNAYFRAGAGVVLIDRSGLVLGLERSDVPGSWQFPQGGIGPAEEPFEAALRELQEETGIPPGSIDLIDEFPSWLAYGLPAAGRSAKTGRGQVHRWFLARHIGDHNEIDLDAPTSDGEFSRWRWMPITELVELTWEIRQPIYRTLAAHWSAYFA